MEAALTAETTILSGKLIAERVLSTVRQETADLIAETGVQPGIAVVIAGTDPASQVYVRSKGKRATECGFKSVEHKLDETVSEEELMALLHTLNADPSIHGILVQLPLPSHINEARIIQEIDPAKDVDGFHLINVGKLTTGMTETAAIPCTPAGCMILIEEVIGKDLSGKSAVVIGRSNIVGKPMASLLLQANATVTIAHSRTKDLPSVCRQADILVAAVGRPEMVKADWIKPGAIVIDVGINRVANPPGSEKPHRIVGDVDFEDCKDVASAITPVPGGVGVMTIALLMANTLKAAKIAAGK
jgi:methylenetetrahydrofolate dehydrogenase (NADP+) / methenyltetrahydrofolate cyclohydrolase